MYSADAKPDLREFWFRRLHSLTGFLPLSLFLIVHFLGNLYSTMPDNGQGFNDYAKKLHSLPIFNLMEMSILIPLFYHAIYGTYRAIAKEKWEVFSMQNGSHVRYFFQRLTGLFLFFFVIMHIWNTRVQDFLGHTVDFHYMQNHLREPVYGVLYLLGVASASYHWAQGLWGFCITWGITTGLRSQSVSVYVCFLLGISIFLMGFNAYLGFYGLGFHFAH
jgi:succinate dehydrogenase / fumarate reductase cytochrome b subunit